MEPTGVPTEGVATTEDSSVSTRNKECFLKQGKEKLPSGVSVNGCEAEASAVSSAASEVRKNDIAS